MARGTVGLAEEGPAERGNFCSSNGDSGARALAGLPGAVPDDTSLRARHALALSLEQPPACRLAGATREPEGLAPPRTARSLETFALTSPAGRLGVERGAESLRAEEPLPEGTRGDLSHLRPRPTWGAPKRASRVRGSGPPAFHAPYQFLEKQKLRMQETGQLPAPVFLP